MELTAKQKAMITFADGYWAHQHIQSAQQLSEWQERSYLPEDIREQMARRELTPTEQTQLGTLFNANSTHLIMDLISHHLRETLKSCHERGETTASSYELASSILFLPEVLERALNPLGWKEHATESAPLASLATKALYTKALQFPTASYDAFPAYTLEVLTPYLPQEYMKLLRFEFQPKEQVPTSDIQTDTIQLSTNRLIRKIGQDKGSEK